MGSQFFLRRVVGGLKRGGVKRLAAQGGKAARAGIRVAVEIAAGQYLADGGEVVAHQGHVRPGVQRCLDTLCRVGDTKRARHVEVVANDCAIKAQRAQFGEMHRREAGGTVVGLREDDMRRHQRFDAAFNLADEGITVRFAFVRIARVLRQGVVRVANDTAMSGVVFANGNHANRAQAAPQRIGKEYHHGGIGVKGAVADNAGSGVLQIQHRGEAEINVKLAQLISDNDACRFRQFAGEQRAAVKTAAKRAHRRDGGEAVAETLHSPTFVINANERVRALRADGGAEPFQLRRAAVIAAEEDDARTKGAVQQRRFLREQHRSLNANDDCTHASSRKNAILTRHHAGNDRAFCRRRGGFATRGEKISRQVLTRKGFACLMRVLSTAK